MISVLCRPQSVFVLLALFLVDRWAFKERLVADLTLFLRWMTEAL